MATRVVLLGPNDGNYCAALVMSPLDADATVNAGCIRPEIAYRGGELRDAITFRMTEDYVARRGKGDPWAAWLLLREFLVHMHGISEIKVETPIPFV